MRMDSREHRRGSLHTSLFFRSLCLFLTALLFLLSFSVDRQVEQAKEATGTTKGSEFPSATGTAIDESLTPTPPATLGTPETSDAAVADTAPDVDGPVIARPPVGAFSGVRKADVSRYLGVPYATPPV